MDKAQCEADLHYAKTAVRVDGSTWRGKYIGFLEELKKEMAVDESATEEEAAVRLIREAYENRVRTSAERIAVLETLVARLHMQAVAARREIIAEVSMWQDPETQTDTLKARVGALNHIFDNTLSEKSSGLRTGKYRTAVLEAELDVMRIHTENLARVIRDMRGG